MSDQIWDLQSDIGHLQAENRDLRTNVDALLDEMVRQRQEIADLKRFFVALRNRVDHAELATA